jgi:uncharacterized protein
MAHPNEDLLRREVEGVSSGGSLDDIFTEDIVIHYPGNSPMSGDYQGFAGLDEFFGKFDEILTLIERDIHAVIANDEHGVELLTARAERKDGRKHEWQAVWICHFRDGKISEFWGTFPDQAALDEFLS